MIKPIILFLLFCAEIFSAQSTFNYTRDWGTYYGAVRNSSTGVDLSATEDLFGSIHADASLYNGTNTLYHNQFITSGMQGFGSGNDNRLEGKFNSNGTIQYSTYALLTNSGTGNNADYVRMIHREPNGSYYMIERRSAQNNTSTPGAWLTDFVELTSDNKTLLLAKHDSMGNLLWRTYIPGVSPTVEITSDENGNLYLSGLTNYQNLGDSNSFQQGFVISYSNGNIRPNSFILKLSSSGQRMWATYYPATSVNALNTYAGNLYIITGSDFIATDAVLATAGTFQQTKTNFSIAKFNAVSGQRMWGTYYGFGYGSGPTFIKANETGLYTLGTTYDFDGATGYFSTPGAYQMSTAGTLDIFLTKFNQNGNRIWSTYFGGTAVQEATGFDIKSDKILFSGYTTSASLASPNSFVQTKPNPGKFDHFFSMFNTDGERLFTSYYGGTDPYNFIAQNIKCFFSRNTDAFYLFGTTQNRYGYTTENAWQNAIIYPTANNVGDVTTFIAKFTSKFLSSSESTKDVSIQLFDNPNNGNFTLEGTLLEKEKCSVQLYDASGKLVYKENLSKNKIQKFNLESILSSGFYALSLKHADGSVIKNFKILVKK